MPQARIALISVMVFLGTTALRAQVAHMDVCDTCAGDCCSQGCDCGECCSSGCGRCQGLTGALHGALGGILRHCHMCTDARHGIYKAALRRNTFDKKIRIPVAYYTHLFPMYRHNRCCCGPVVPTDDCPACGPGGGMGEEVIEMYDVPDAMPQAQTPADPAPGEILDGSDEAPKEARDRYYRKRRSASRTHKTNRQGAVQSVSQQKTEDRVAQRNRSNAQSGMSLGQFITFVLRPEPQPKPTIRQLSAVEKQGEPEPGNPLR